MEVTQTQLNLMRRELSNTYKKIILLKKYMAKEIYNDLDELVKYFYKEIKYNLENYSKNLSELIKELKNQGE